MEVLSISIRSTLELSVFIKANIDKDIKISIIDAINKILFNFLRVIVEVTLLC